MKKSVKKNSKRIKKNQILLGKMKYGHWNNSLQFCEKSIRECEDDCEFINVYNIIRPEGRKFVKYPTFEINKTNRTVPNRHHVKTFEYVLNNENSKFTKISKAYHRILHEMFNNLKHIISCITYKEFISFPEGKYYGHFVTEEDVQYLYNVLCNTQKRNFRLPTR